MGKHLILMKNKSRPVLENAGSLRGQNQSAKGASYDHALVIGGSIAGLMAARILTGYFNQVTVIDRDRSREAAEFRQGVPQARHAHTLLPHGQMILEQVFPGLVDELLAGGAIAVYPERDTAVYENGQWSRPRANPEMLSVVSSRPMLEDAIYRRVADHPAVRFMEGYEAIGLEADEKGQRVAGVRLRRRHDPNAPETFLKADLVVDASGRQSMAPRWLQDLGYTPPDEWMVNAFTGYASRLYRRPADYEGNWKTLYIRPTVDESSRGGILIPLEGNRWHVTLIGMGGDYPPTDDAGFLNFARSLPTQMLYRAIKESEPLTRVYGYRNTANRLRHYDLLPRYLEGFLVLGDAVYTLNPVYALGITAAAMGAQALERSLQEQRRREPAGELVGLAPAFQKQLRKTIARFWRMATSDDRLWPGTKVDEHVPSLGQPVSKPKATPALA